MPRQRRTSPDRATVRAIRPRRVAVVSAHTSPLDQPGEGDAGGLNVYVLETARRLARAGVGVDVFTRATHPSQPSAVVVEPGLVVRHVVAGPVAPLPKEDLPGQLCAFAAGVFREQARHGPGHYDLVHSHYWLSGEVGWLAADRWGVPLVHTPHTLARVKNGAVAADDAPEPNVRILGEDHLARAADRIVVNAADEAAALVALYGTDPARVEIVHPGVDLGVFRPGDRQAARAALGLGPGPVVAFVGRLQPLKSPDVAIRAAALLPDRDRVTVLVAGGASGARGQDPADLAGLAARVGIGDRVRFLPPTDRPGLAQIYRAADVLVMPSRSESFGLVALEAQACGTPVVAADVGGLRTAVRDGVTGVLVPGHDPADWAAAIAAPLADPAQLARLGVAAAEHAAGFSWEVTADRTLAAYRGVLGERDVWEGRVVGG